MSFTEWLNEVDLQTMKRVGCSVHDLPDFSSRDMFDAGIDPDEAAEEALREAGFEAVM